MTYVCQTLDPVTNQCVAWVEQANFITELSQLSYSDSSVLLSLTAAIFASAWMWKRLSLHASR